MNSLERTIAKIQGRGVDHLPLHPLFMIYAADSIGVKYFEYLQDYRLLVKGQLAVAEQYGLDLVSCCSDAWREAADCGAELEWLDHQPPLNTRPVLSSSSELATLAMPDPTGGGRMTDRLEAIRLFVSQVKGETPILGWIEGPVAESVNLFGMNEFMLATIDDIHFVRELMDWTTEMEKRFALAQVKAGADMIGMGDAAASLVTPVFYESEVVPREKSIIYAIHNAGAFVRLHICGSIKGKFKAMEATGADLIDVDYPQTVREVRKSMKPHTCLSGNLNPVTQLCKSTPERIHEDFAQCYREAGEAYMVAPGCEVPPETPEANMRAMCDFAHSTT